MRWAEAIKIFCDSELQTLYSALLFFQGLPGTKNFYLETDSGVKVGVWQILPVSQVEEAEGKELDWWDNQLSDGR